MTRAPVAYVKLVVSIVILLTSFRGRRFVGGPYRPAGRSRKCGYP
jgi:hypothetical protein